MICSQCGKQTNDENKFCGGCGSSLDAAKCASTVVSSTSTVTCTHCGYERQIPAEKIPATEVKVICPKCRQTFTFGSPSAHSASPTASKSVVSSNSMLSARKEVTPSPSGDKPLRAVMYVVKNGAQSGPIEEVEVRRQIDTGALNATDLCWREGMVQWQPLAVVLGVTPKNSNAAGITPSPSLPRVRPSMPPPPSRSPQPATNVAIWNPNAAANWCLIFSPAFGSYLHMLNWRSLGEPEKEAAAKWWFNASLVMLAVYVFIGAFMANSGAAQGANKGFGFIFLLTWYFVEGREQGKYVKEKIGETYTKKPWGQALLIGVAALIGYVIAAAIFGFFIGLVTSGSQAI